jgi:transcriptional regulator with XRE-family HTH domain
MTDIIEQLKTARQAQAMTQSGLGKKLGLPQSHISRIEQKEADLRLSTLTDMARVLDMELMLVPRPMISRVRAILHGEGRDGRRFQPDEEDGT